MFFLGLGDVDLDEIFARDSNNGLLG